MRRLALFLLATMGSLALAAGPDEPLASLPYTPGLDVSAMDRSADACTDFYQYACGGWMKANPIPADQSTWDVYGKLAQDNRRFLWGILADLAQKTRGRDATQQKIGDYFASCMDESAVESRGVEPLRPYLERIEAMASKRDLAATLASLHLATGDDGFFFSFGSGQDFSDATRVIAFAAEGGLGLPDRDYYLKDDARSKQMREKYAAHVARMFELLGDTADVVQAEAATVMRIETALAKASLTRVENQDPYNLFHKMGRAGLHGLAPALDWDAYLKDMGLPRVAVFNVTQPEFLREVDRQVESASLDDIKTYLRWHVAHTAAPFLSAALVNENFDFYGKTLHGVPELQPRWKRCVTLVNRQLGDALGREYVRRVFSPALKAKALAMTRQIEQAMGRDIASLPWMGPATKRAALRKLHAVVNKIGYPDRWRDYGTVTVKRDDFFGNVERAQRFESKRDLAKIGRPLDRGEWFMPPPTVNAYYSQQMNDINFPAGVLQPPLFDPRMDDAPNYGNTGGTIGHELTHGFDNEGRKFDARGNLRDWWAPRDAQAFTDRAQCVVDQYQKYVVVDDIHINSELTQGEDIADLGGLILAWAAWKTETAGKALPRRDGLTPDQRFFVGYAQWACENDRPETLRVRALTDPHSPAKYRVNGVMVNIPEFQQAFACKPGQPMVAEKRCRAW
jgi:endothelin-converting enzyme/putative endopeptidase